MKGNGKIEITDGLLIAFINGDLETTEANEVQKWIESADENKAHLESIRKAWEFTANVEPKPVVVDTEKAWQNVFDQIENSDPKVVPLNPTNNRKIYLGIAAMVVVLLGIFSILNLFNQDPNNVTRFAENAGVVDKLPDGSVVTLNENSSIVYPEKFASNERRISLKGEAFFEIERNEEKPFIIDLPEEIYVKVLGTSFNIKAEDQDSLTEVYVKTGKVEFGTLSNHIELVAGEKGIMNHNTGEVYRVEGNKVGMQELYWMDANLNFQGTSLNEVIEILNFVYEDEVVLTCNELGEKPFTSEHKKDDPLEEVVSVIAAVFELSTTVEEVDGKQKFTLGCND